MRVAIERTRRRLPDGAETPVVFKFDPSQSPVVQLGVVGREEPGPGPVELRQTVEDQLLFRLERIPGVSQVTISGGLRRQIQVELDQARMQARVLNQYRNLGQVRSTIVAFREGAPIYVGDIAAVSEGTEDRTSLVRINGRPGVLVQVLRQPGTNTVAVADRIIHETPDGRRVPDRHRRRGHQ